MTIGKPRETAIFMDRNGTKQAEPYNARALKTSELAITFPRRTDILKKLTIPVRVQLLLNHKELYPWWYNFYKICYICTQ